MHLLPGLAALAVAGIYYAWRGYWHGLLRREHTLRARVAYMLWVAADRAE
jgi:hypothetical protein